MMECLIRTLDEKYACYLSDETSEEGIAESISFPRSEEEAAGIVKCLQENRITDITVQGARTGLAGLAASVNWLKETGLAEIHHKELSLTNRLIAGFLDIPGVQYFGPDPSCDHGAIVSVTIDGVDPQEAAMLLDSAFSIAVRAGLHCAPYAHDSIGTLHTGGTIRFSPNLFSSADEIDACIQAVSALAQM